MLASDEDIDQFMKAGWLKIEPEWTDEERDALLQPASIDLRLDRHFRFMTKPQLGEFIDPRLDQADFTEARQVPPGKVLVLGAGDFVLASTWEIVTLNFVLAGRIEGKSSLGRLGLMVHSTAGFIDPGFSGQITLEIANLANRPILLRPGMAVAQLGVFATQNGTRRPYGAERGSHYQGQRGPVPSRAHRGFRIWDLDDARLGPGRGSSDMQ